MTKEVPSLRRVLNDLTSFAGENDIWDESAAVMLKADSKKKQPYNYDELVSQLTSLAHSGNDLAVALNTKKKGKASVVGIFGGHDAGLANARVMVAAGRFFEAVSEDLREVLGVLQGLARDADDVVQEIEEMDKIPPEVGELRDALGIIRDRLREVS